MTTQRKIQEAEKFCESQKSLQKEFQSINTAIKSREQNFRGPQQPTTKKLVLFNENKKECFAVLRDCDIGISSMFQNIVIESYNDDDKRTSSTQLQKGMTQTVQDLYEILALNRQRPQTQAP